MTDPHHSHFPVTAETAGGAGAETGACEGGGGGGGEAETAGAGWDETCAAGRFTPLPHPTQKFAPSGIRAPQLVQNILSYSVW